MDMRMPPLKTKIMLESNPLKSRIFVRRLAGMGCLQSLPGAFAEPPGPSWAAGEAEAGRGKGSRKPSLA